MYTHYTALEASACGLLVIATAGGPTDEFLREDEGTVLRIKSKRQTLADTLKVRRYIEHLYLSWKCRKPGEGKTNHLSYACCLP